MVCTDKNKKLKEEREERWARAAIAIQQISYAKLITKHEERKSELLLLTQLHNGSGAQSSSSFLRLPAPMRLHIGFLTNFSPRKYFVISDYTF